MASRPLLRSLAPLVVGAASLGAYIGLVGAFTACSEPTAVAPNEPPPTANNAGGASGGNASGGNASGGSAGASAGAGGNAASADCDAELPPDRDAFGPNVHWFDPSSDPVAMQATIDSVFAEQEDAQFGDGRHAFLIAPGTYGLTLRVGFSTQVLGLGASPDDTVLSPGLHVDADWWGGNATLNFWRGVENFTTRSQQSTLWAVSQATPFRRMHVNGSLTLADSSWSSGGYIADSVVDGLVNSGSQQQWFSRNSTFKGWLGGVWNMTFVGVSKTPFGTWPSKPYTVVPTAPVLREKPYLRTGASGGLCVVVPPLRTDASGPSWTDPTGPAPARPLPLSQFYVARADVDSASSMNAALAAGKHLLLTPGIYSLDAPLLVTAANTVVLGIGFPTLIPQGAHGVLQVADVDGVSIAGLLVDAGAVSSPTLVEIGPPGSSADHSANPTAIHDVFVRVGGAREGRAELLMAIHSNDVLTDHLWLWRADHGTGVAWATNVNRNGLLVEGDHVTSYGLFVEHQNEHQVLWNGDHGRNYFYQSELAYDPPSQSEWRHDGVDGFAAFKVGDAVTHFEGWGMGVYSNFHQEVFAERAFEAPEVDGVVFHHLVTHFLTGQGGIRHVLNARGGAAVKATPHQTLD